MKKTYIVILLLLATLAGGTRAQTSERPLILPFQDPPGPDTWLLGQAYGNTVGAFNFGSQWYSAGQGLHFGLDFPAPCGTPLVAVADGEVTYVDNLSFGSAPHNVILRHPEIGLSTLYGHLQSRSELIEGQPIKQGDFVGYSGDPDGTCDSRPHLHLEIRSADFRTALNPVIYMDAEWPSLALIGAYSLPFFQMDLNNARRWMSLDDQPPVAFGGARLNGYSASWPLPRGMAPAENPPLARPYIPLGMDFRVRLQRVGYDQCCRDYWWDSVNPDRFYTVDGAPGQRATIFTWSVPNSAPLDTFGPAPRPLLSPDGSHEVRLVAGRAEIVRLADGSTWTMPSQGILPAISTDNSRAMWIRRGGIAVPGQADPGVEIFLSDISGNTVVQITAQAGTNARWLDNQRLLLSVPEDASTRYEVLDTGTGEQYALGTFYRPRNLSVAPGGEQFMFYLSGQADPANNGVYVMDTQRDAQARKLPWFGPWRWRDAGSLYYIPYVPTAPVHQLRYYDLLTGEDRALTDPVQQAFTILDGKWELSADGGIIAFHDANDRNLWWLRVIEE